MSLPRKHPVVPFVPNPSGLCQCGCGGITAKATANLASRGYRKGEHVQWLRGHAVTATESLNPSGRCQCGCGWPTSIAPRTDRRKGRIKGKPMRFVPGHSSARSPVAFVLDPDSGCWNWQRFVDEKGYGRRHGGGSDKAHRHYYELLVEPIEEDRDLHHTCENKGCINPRHLRPVTRAEHRRLHEEAR